MAAFIPRLGRLVKSWRGIGGRETPDYFNRSSPIKRVMKTIISPLKKEEEKIKREEERIAQTLRTLRKERKKLTQRKKEFSEISKKWKEEQERITVEILAIKEKLPVRVMRVIEETVPSRHPIILVETKTMTAKIDGKVRRIGKYLIRLDPFAREIGNRLRIANLWKRVYRSGESTYYDHPCIRNSELCMGNGYEDFEEVFKKKEIYNLVMLAIGFLRKNHTVGPYESWNDWLNEARPLPEGSELFPNRNYSLIDDESEESSEPYISFVDTISSSTSMSSNGWTGITFDQMVMNRVEWEEYVRGPRGIEIARQGRIISMENAKEAEIETLRGRIKELSENLARGQNGMGLVEGAMRSAFTVTSNTSAPVNIDMGGVVPF